MTDQERRQLVANAIDHHPSASALTSDAKAKAIDFGVVLSQERRLNWKQIAEASIEHVSQESTDAER